MTNSYKNQLTCLQPVVKNEDLMPLLPPRIPRLTHTSQNAGNPPETKKVCHPHQRLQAGIHRQQPHGDVHLFNADAPYPSRRQIVGDCPQTFPKHSSIENKIKHAREKDGRGYHGNPGRRYTQSGESNSPGRMRKL